MCIESEEEEEEARGTIFYNILILDCSTHFNCYLAILHSALLTNRLNKLLNYSFRNFLKVKVYYYILLIVLFLKYTAEIIRVVCCYFILNIRITL